MRARPQRGRRIGVLLALLAWAGWARADDERAAARQATLLIDDKLMLRMSVSYRDVVDADTAAKLAGGLPTTIVLRAYVFRGAATRAPVTATYKACRVTFDLWDEVYRIEISQSGEPDATTASPTLDGVLRRCAEVDKLAVGPRGAFPAPATYYLNCVVEVNPVSPEMLERIKRWVSRPSGTGATAPGDALFGSFVGLFVARIGTADRMISFRTQSFSLSPCDGRRDQGNRFLATRPSDGWRRRAVHVARSAPPYPGGALILG